MKTMRKMMLVVISVLSLSACVAESNDPGDTAVVSCKVNSDCGATAGCDVITETCVTDADIREEQTMAERFDRAAIDTVAPTPPQPCLWHSECPSNVCDLTTRTCRDYPF